MIDVVGKKWWFFAFSGLIIVPGTVFLIRFGLRPAIDFTGGSLVEVQVPPGGDQRKMLTSAFTKENVEVSSVSVTDANTYLLRTKPIDNPTHRKISTDLQTVFGTVTEKRFESVGPVVGKELTQKAFQAVALASLAIIVYIALSFRKIPRPYSSWKFGVSAVVALLHDVLVVVGIFAILGYYLHVEVDALFVTALLTIIGFSVHDTIVVFDRIRENLGKMPGAELAEVVNTSIVQTFVRSLNTSVTVLMTLLAILLFGGETIRWFVFALFVGIASGTYSSIFNAAPILVLWEERSKKR
jgi:preprotein translocase subunit SecF